MRATGWGKEEVQEEYGQEMRVTWKRIQRKYTIPLYTYKSD